MFANTTDLSHNGSDTYQKSLRNAVIDLEEELMQAIADDNPALVESLLDQGASVDEMDPSGLRAIHVAVSKQNKSILELLLNRGASVHATSYNGFITPLDRAVDRENADVGIVKLLLNKFDKEAIDALSNDWEKPVLHNAAKRKNLDVVRLLLERGVRVEMEDRRGRTALHRAALIEGNGLVMRELLQRGCYSYPSPQFDHYIEKYWERNQINTPEDELLYTSMLLAGVKVPEKELETSPLTIHHIMFTVDTWLPTPTSPGDEFESALAVLRAFPRLIHWLDCVDNSASKKLGPWLFKKAENGKKDDAFTELFTRLDKIPTELKDLVREDFNQSTLADLLVGRLEKIYGLEKCIAQYLVTKVMAHLKEYRAFHTRLWEHDWKSGMCEPPMVGSNLTAEMTNLLSSLGVSR